MKKKILVIDDDKFIRDVVKDVLEPEGFNVIEGVTSEEAISKANHFSPDLIILDLGISPIGGLEVCQILRKEEKTKAIPIIMLTGHSAEIDKLTGLEMGADDYITKPFHIGELLARIKAVLRRFKYRKNRKFSKKKEVLINE